MNHAPFFNRLFTALKGAGYHDFILTIEDERFIGRQIGIGPIIEQIVATDEPTHLKMTSPKGATVEITIMLEEGGDHLLDYGAATFEEMEKVTKILESLK